MKQPSSTASWQLAHPKHWPMWLGVSLLWLLAKLPYRLSLGVGKTLGRSVFYLHARWRHITRTNINLCFPELNPKLREQLVRASFDSLGMGLIEAGLAYWASDRRLKRLVHYENFEHIDAALAAGNGAIVLGIHFTTLELASRIARLRGLPVNAIYHPLHNPVAAFITDRARQRHGTQLIASSDIRKVIRALKRNELVWLTPDHDRGIQHSVFATFFNIHAATIVAPSKLAKLTHSPIIPSSYYRLPNHQGYTLKLLPPLANFPSDDLNDDTQRINDYIEHEIRQQPEQYLWCHRRFKHRPAGHPSFYT